MSTPQQDPRSRPPRAQPLQPDRPGRGDDQVPADSPDGTPGSRDAGADADAAARRQKKQSEDAVSNVREGYK